jgi:hypothetical protein
MGPRPGRSLSLQIRPTATKIRRQAGARRKILYSRLSASAATPVGCSCTFHEVDAVAVNRSSEGEAPHHMDGGKELEPTVEGERDQSSGSSHWSMLCRSNTV